MELRFEKQNTILFIQLKGELDHHCAEEIREKIEREFIRINGRSMVFLFQEVTFMDSSGIGMLIGRYKLAQNMGGQAVICGASGKVLEVFRLSGLTKLIPIYPTKEAAQKALTGRETA